tara:strand:- start:467 stop:844 length:378 start_codon:yes stop_codon:yes gene_type:complete
MNNQISLDDARKSQEQLAKQFNQIGRSLVLSNKETWKLFLAQEESDVIPREHLPLIKSVLLGRPSVPIDVYRDLTFSILQKLHYCPVMRVLYKMADGNLMPELVQRYLKITADVLKSEAQPGPNV